MYQLVVGIPSYPQFDQNTHVLHVLLKPGLYLARYIKSQTSTVNHQLKFIILCQICIQNYSKLNLAYLQFVNFIFPSWRVEI